MARKSTNAATYNVVTTNGAQQRVVGTAGSMAGAQCTVSLYLSGKGTVAKQVDYWAVIVAPSGTVYQASGNDRWAPIAGSAKAKAYQTAIVAANGPSKPTSERQAAYSIVGTIPAYVSAESTLAPFTADSGEWHNPDDSIASWQTAAIAAGAKLHFNP